MGLVAQVFDEEKLQALPGDVAIGHTRYSTTGSNAWANAQPLVHHGRARTVAIGHNGNLTNTTELRAASQRTGSRSAPRPTRRRSRPCRERPRPARRGGRARCPARGRLLGRRTLGGEAAGLRGPAGIRPLSLGRLGDDWVVASETCAFDLIGAVYERDVRPGELLVIDEEGVHATQALPGGGRQSASSSTSTSPAPTRRSRARRCGVRVRMGERLAAEAPVEADLVMPIPDSGTPAAVGFTRASGIPYSERPDQEPLRRPHVHPAGRGLAPAGSG